MSTLIPSFAANFPDKADAAVSGLIHLSRPSASWETEPALAEASCLSALEGLGTVCKAAAETSQERAVMKGAEFLLRCVFCILVRFLHAHVVATQNLDLTVS